MCVSLVTHRTSYSTRMHGMENECVHAGCLAVKAIRTSLGTHAAMCQCPAEGKTASTTKASSFQTLAYSKAGSQSV